MEDSKNYVGKVVKVHYTDNSGKSASQTGIVLSQRTLSSGTPQLNMLLIDGREWLSTYVKAEKITSARIDENLRKCLTEYYKAKVDQTAFLNNFQKERAVHEEKVGSALKAIRDVSGVMSWREFSDAVENLFRDTFPQAEDHNSWYKKYFHCSSGSQTEVTLSHVQDIEKYASPEKYSFIRREYDGCLFIEPDTPGFKQFCEKHAPAEIPGMKGKCKTSVDAEIGDKNWLTVERVYHLPLTNGYSRQSLKDLSDLIHSPVKSKLSDRIQAAEGRKTAAGTTSKTNTKKKDHER